MDAWHEFRVQNLVSGVIFRTCEEMDTAGSVGATVEKIEGFFHKISKHKP